MQDAAARVVMLWSQTSRALCLLLHDEGMHAKLNNLPKDLRWGTHILHPGVIEALNTSKTHTHTQCDTAREHYVQNTHILTLH